MHVRECVECEAFHDVEYRDACEAVFCVYEERRSAYEDGATKAMAYKLCSRISV